MDQCTNVLTAREAAELLGVKRATLYAYASRGLLSSVDHPDHSRARGYLRTEVERLRARSRRRSPAAVAAAALSFGEPVLESAICFPDERGPVYRGHPATGLVGQPFEVTAELLWSGSIPGEPAHWTDRFEPDDLTSVSRLVPPEAPALAALGALVPALALGDPARYGAPPDQIYARGRGLIRAMAAFLAVSRGGTGDVVAAVGAPSVAEVVARALGARDVVVPLLDAGLVLLADHELNASTFAARVAASTGADLYACLSAALGALAGPRHGTASERAGALLDEVAEPERAAVMVHERLRQGERLPGFGHPLYPAGDPRAEALLVAITRVLPEDPAPAVARALDAAMRRVGRPSMNVDLALATLCRAAGLPPSVAPGLFAVARAAGWVAHVVEQQQDPRILRPRARRKGP